VTSVSIEENEQQEVIKRLNLGELSELRPWAFFKNKLIDLESADEGCDR